MDESLLARTPHWQCIGLTFLLLVGYGPFAGLLVLATEPPESLAFALVPIGLGVAFVLYRHLRKKGTAGACIATEILILGVLVAWGLSLNQAAQARCVASTCDPNPSFRPLAVPFAYYLCGLHVLTVLAYAVSRRRRALLPAGVELVLLSGLFVGCVLQFALALQFLPVMHYGIILAPVLLPAISPVLAIALFAQQIRHRFRLRVRAMNCPDIARLGSLTLAWLGLYGAMTAVMAGRSAASIEVFTKTCGYTFSQIPVVFEEAQCHYLCTVAARGHRRLVRPIRLGMRRGHPIVVNRQLAVANAFEDLVTERFPRFGRFARRVYDRIGLPISLWIVSPLLADVVYLLMKPAEWSLYTYLLLADPGCPEERLSRMYSCEPPASCP